MVSSDSEEEVDPPLRPADVRPGGSGAQRPPAAPAAAAPPPRGRPDSRREKRERRRAVSLASLADPNEQGLDDVDFGPGIGGPLDELRGAVRTLIKATTRRQDHPLMYEFYDRLKTSSRIGSEQYRRALEETLWNPPQQQDDDEYRLYLRDQDEDDGKTPDQRNRQVREIHRHLRSLFPHRFSNKGADRLEAFLKEFVATMNEENIYEQPAQRVFRLFFEGTLESLVKGHLKKIGLQGTLDMFRQNYQNLEPLHRQHRRNARAWRINVQQPVHPQIAELHMQVTMSSPDMESTTIDNQVKLTVLQQLPLWVEEELADEELRYRRAHQDRPMPVAAWTGRIQNIINKERHLRERTLAPDTPPAPRRGNPRLSQNISAVFDRQEEKMAERGRIPRYEGRYEDRSLSPEPHRMRGRERTPSPEYRQSRTRDRYASPDFRRPSPQRRPRSPSPSPSGYFHAPWQPPPPPPYARAPTGPSPQGYPYAGHPEMATNPPVAPPIYPYGAHSGPVNHSPSHYQTICPVNYGQDGWSQGGPRPTQWRQEPNQANHQTADSGRHWSPGRGQNTPGPHQGYLDKREHDRRWIKADTTEHLEATQHFPHDRFQAQLRRRGQFAPHDSPLPYDKRSDGSFSPYEKILALPLWADIFCMNKRTRTFEISNVIVRHFETRCTSCGMAGHESSHPLCPMRGCSDTFTLCAKCRTSFHLQKDCSVDMDCVLEAAYNGRPAPRRVPFPSRESEN